MEVKVNFGYVAMSMLVKDCSPSKTITLANLLKIREPEIRINKLKTLAKTNIKNTQRLFYHNKAHNIMLYRLTSKLIPLATHPVTEEWDWVKDLKEDFKALGEYVKTNNFRISAHPDHFTLLNSPKKEVIDSSIKDLEYHHNIFNSMGLGKDAKLVLHIGGKYKSKAASIDNFIEAFLKLPQYIKERIILENDDKVYTAKEVLDICQNLKIPMVLDIHHHWCNNNNEDLSNLIEDIFNTWSNEKNVPKIHLSSPKSKKNFRSHADYIDVDFFVDFLKKAKVLNRNFDVMIEAKNKDKALFKLIKDLKEKNIKIINNASIEY